MKDILGQLYNGFLLRDLLGYVVPGAFVLACLTHILSIVTKTPIKEITQLVPDKTLVYFFLVCLCYICGHFLSGIFFHSPLFRWMFSYSPTFSSSENTGMSKEEAWSMHRGDYRKACDSIGESMQSHIERHGALLHFTGHISASFIFTISYVFILAFYRSSWHVLLYSIPILIIFPGVFLHYRRLSIERYYLERAAIKAAAEKIEVLRNQDESPTEV